MHSKTLANWRAKRAGGRITVYGDDVKTHATTKIVGVDTILPDTRVSGSCRAVDKNGITHTLLLN